MERKPEWLRIKPPHNSHETQVSDVIRTHRLNTICVSGRCPNRGECWSCGTATFMIGGNTCTRACRFCNVATGKPMPLDRDEPERIANSVKELQLKHVVLTSVDRDDLTDLGAQHWANVVKAIKDTVQGITVEVLIPDFQGKADLIRLALEANPDVAGHNLETVKRLTKHIRCRATYETSLTVLKNISSWGYTAKSGIMLGLGEKREEVLQTMDNLLEAGCSIMTIGQYLQPSKTNIEVKEYIHPDIFEEYRLKGIEKGFRHIESAPLARSSYHAGKHVK